MKRILAFLFAAAALTACSDDNGDGTGRDIQLAPGTPKDYTIFADETSGTPSEGIVVRAGRKSGCREQEC